MLGIDVVDIDRLRVALERRPRLEQRLFTEGERTYCRGAVDPVVHFAGTLAAKEAVIKALRLGASLAWARRVEISRDEAGAPTAHVRGTSKASRALVSISHDGPVAVAVAIDLGSLYGGRRSGGPGEGF